jgi:predicted nuclease with TOPRIM domain
MAEIVTEADMLMEILAERGEAPIPLIAHVIGVDETVIENWAKILEKHGMVQLRYPLLGKPVVEFKAAEQLREEFRKRFLEAQREKSELAFSEFPKIESMFKKMDRDNISEVEKEVKARLNKVEGLNRRLNEVSTRLEVKDKEISEKYEKLIDKYKSMLIAIDEKKGMETY